MNGLRWKSDRTKELLERLGPIPEQCGLIPVFAGVRAKDYEGIVLGTPTQKLLKGYVACIYPLVINVLRAAPKNERVEFVFEQQHEYQPFAECALSAIISLKRHRPDWFLTEKGETKLAGWRFVSKNSLVFTEPADFFVYALRQLYQDRDSQKTKWCRPIMNSGGGFGLGTIMKRSDIREAMRQLPMQAAYVQTLRRSGHLDSLDPDVVAAALKHLDRSIKRN